MPIEGVESTSGMRGAFRLFRVAGIQVYLHFSWFIIAALEVTQFSRRYQSPVWGLFEYLALFAIVLLHEFGHAFACRQTGGQADRIVLWPLGGVAFVKPPQRPGAYLWSIAAGPLVNAVLLPIFMLAVAAASRMHWRSIHADLYRFIFGLSVINLWLLLFNLLPVYPLDGGQIVRALLWFPLGASRSLKISSVIGFIGAVAFAAWAYYVSSIWLGVLAFFIFSQAQVGWRAAQNLDLESDVAPRLTAESPPPIDEKP
jgi:Zn-dependent protease